MKRKYTIAKVIIALGLLIWLLKSGRLDFGMLLSVPLSILHLYGILVLLGSMLVQAVRWWWLLRIQKIDVSLQKAIQLTWIGYFFTLVLPGMAGGELIRSYYIVKESYEAKVGGTSTVLLDRVFGLYTMLLLGFSSLIIRVSSNRELSSELVQIGILIFMLVIGSTVVLLGIMYNPTRKAALNLVPKRFIAPVESTLNSYHTHRPDLFICFALSLLACVMLMSGFFLSSRVLGTPLTWNEVFLVGPLVFVANTLPISPGGIGIGETAASVLFATCNVETGATIMLIVRFWLVILRLPGLLIYIFGMRTSSWKPSSE